MKGLSQWWKYCQKCKRYVVIRAGKMLPHTDLGGVKCKER